MSGESLALPDPGMSPEELDRLAGRNGQIWRDYCGGRTQESLARQHGISQARVSQIISQVRASIPEVKREEEVQRSLEMLRELRAGALEVYRLAAAPVTVGKDGDLLYDPEVTGPDGRPSLVRDHTGRLRALETAVKVEQRIGQILGYDAAQKLDMHVEAGERVAAERLAEEARARLQSDQDDQEG